MTPHDAAVARKRAEERARLLEFIEMTNTRPNPQETT